MNLLLVLCAALGCRQASSGELSPTSDQAAQSAGGEAAAPLPMGAKLGGQLKARYDQLTLATQKIRELYFRRPVPAVTQDAALIAKHIERDLQQEELDKAHALYTSLGLLDPFTDIKALVLGVLSEQVVGYYDPKRKHLVVRQDVSEGGAPSKLELDMVLVHELVHALQDQHLELEARSERDYDSDEGSAFRALVEGDATLAMFGYALRVSGTDLQTLTNNPKAFAALEAAAASGSSQLDRAPAILRYTLLSSYLDGLRFAAELFKEGGWDAVNRAHKAPPASMEQVLHPELYRRSEMPASCEMGVLAAARSAGFRPAFADTLGELELSVYLGQRKPSGIDRPAAQGWACDRIRLYARQRDPAHSFVVWWSRFDTQKDAKRVARRAKLIAGADQGFVSLRKQRALLLAHGVPKALRFSVKKQFLAAAADWR